MSDGEWFYIGVDGSNQGPVTTAFLRSAVFRGQLKPDDLVWCDGMANWMPCSQVEALQIDPNAPVPPPMPPLPARVAATRDPIVAGSDASHVVYAGFWRRFLALMLDNLILCVPASVLAVVLAGAIAGSHAAPGSAADAAATGMAYIGFYAVYWTLAALYFALQESSSHQATLGKRALGIKVTDVDGRRLTFANALGRWFAASLSYLTFYVGFLMAAFTQRRQALHDIVASTLVVDRWAYSAHPEQQKSGLSGCLVAAILVLVLGIPGVAMLAAIAIPAYQDYIVRAHVAEALAGAAPAQAALDAAFANNQRCPANGEAGVGAATAYAAPRIAAINARTMQNGACALEIVLRATGRADVEGQHIWLEFIPGPQDAQQRWHCTSDIAAKYLPARCRG